MSIVGVIANPASGKDIRRLVAQGRFITNQEKVNILKSIFVGLDSIDIGRVVAMPDSGMLCKRAEEGLDLSFEVEELDMIVFNEEKDSTNAAKLMTNMGVECLITLGGDGTNRAVVKGSRSVPIVPVSTGTNNVFPKLEEGTIAGMAAGLIARKLVDIERVSTINNVLEVVQEDIVSDIALIDVAVSKERFIGARAIWDIDTIHELFLSEFLPGSIGLSSIGAQLGYTGNDEFLGMHLKIGPGGIEVLAPVAPGKVVRVPVKEWRTLKIGERVNIIPRPCTVALDGERNFSLQLCQEAYIFLSDRGPRVVSTVAVMREAANAGIFKRERNSDGI